MIRQCIKDDSMFGIILNMNEKIEQTGCAAKVTKIINEFDNPKYFLNGVFNNQSVDYLLSLSVDGIIKPHGDRDLVQQIITEISRTAIDPRSKAPHPATRIELALDELRWNPDPFLSVERQIKDAVNVLRPVIPLSFETIKLAFRVSGSAYGSVQRVVRSDVMKEQWLDNGDWAFVVEIPAGMKGEYLSKVAKRDPNTEVKELN